MYMQLFIDKTPVRVHSVLSVERFPRLVRVLVCDDMGRPASQHDIPGEGTFRTNGHSYEWRKVLDLS